MSMTMKIVFLYAFYFSSIGTISHSRAAKQGMLRRRQVPFDVTEEDDHELESYWKVRSLQDFSFPNQPTPSGSNDDKPAKSPTSSPSPSTSPSNPPTTEAPSFAPTATSTSIPSTVPTSTTQGSTTDFPKASTPPSIVPSSSITTSISVPPSQKPSLSFTLTPIVDTTTTRSLMPSSFPVAAAVIDRNSIHQAPAPTSTTTTTPNIFLRNLSKGIMKGSGKKNGKTNGGTAKHGVLTRKIGKNKANKKKNVTKGRK